jgi:hypothetical protein
VTTPKKKPSGAHYRRQRRERAAAEADRRAAGVDTRSPMLREMLAQIGPPPLRPVENVAWCNSVAAAMAWDCANDPAVDPRDRRRLTADLLFKCSASYSRAHVEARLQEIARRVYQNDYTPSPPSSSRWQPAEAPDHGNDDGNTTLLTDEERVQWRRVRNGE